METTWIEHLSDPLVLIAFMAFTFAGVIKLLLKNNIIKINQINSAKIIHKTLNYVFILALVGMIFGFLSQKQVLDAVKQPASVSKAEQPNKAQEDKTPKAGNTNTMEGVNVSGNSTVIQAGGDVKLEEKEDK